jgi:hypothetical protein
MRLVGQKKDRAWPGCRFRRPGLLISGLAAACLLGLIVAPPAIARRKASATHAPAAPAANAPPPIATDTGAGEDDDADKTHASADSEVLDNAAVVRLAQAGLGEAAVAEMVRTTKGRYDISTPALVALSKAGVQSGTIAAMIKVQRAAEAAQVRPDSSDPAAPHPAGVYVLARWLPEAKMLAIKPVTTTRTTSGSILGYAYAGGLIPVSYRAIVPQQHAAILVGESRLIFYFFTGSNSGSQNLATVWGAAPDTSEISLVRFAITRNGREIKIGSFNLRGAKTGIDARDALPFSEADAAPGVVAVQPQIDLAPGEYGFVQTAAGVGVGGAQAQTASARVFDFAIADGASISAGLVSREGGSGRAEQVQGSANPVVVRFSPGDYRTTTKTPKPPKEPDSSPSLYPK